MRIVIAADRVETAQKIRAAALSASLDCEAEDAVTWDALAARVVGAAPDIVLVLCRADDLAAISAIKSAHRVTGALVYACGDDTDALLIRDAIRAGAKGFFSLERLWEELRGCVQSLTECVWAARERGMLIGLFSPNGGVGVSTTAVNLAIELAKPGTGRVGLIELRPAPGDLAILLDVELKHCLDDVCRRYADLDERMLRAAFAAHKSGVQVLAQRPCQRRESVSACQATPEAVRELLRWSRQLYSHVVLDLDHQLDENRLEAMRRCDFLGLVVRPDVLGIRRAAWSLQVATQGEVRRNRFSAILSRCGQEGQIPVERVEEILGIPVIQSIPDDGRSLQRAVNEGLAFAELSRHSRISRSISSLADSIRTNARSVVA